MRMMMIYVAVALYSEFAAFAYRFFNVGEKSQTRGLNSERFFMSDLLIRAFCNSISFLLDALSY